MPNSPTAQIVALEGPDALAFAHTQFTSQVNALANGQWQFSSWLDAQGRVRALFHLARLSDERLLLVLRGGNAATFADALRRFVFRSRVKVLVDGGWTLSDATTTQDIAMYAVAASSDTIRLGCGTHTLQLNANANAVDNGNDAWRTAQVHEGWPWLADEALGEFVAPALSLHRLGAVALDKGCYPGQEIVARLHYRGGNKRHLHRVKLSMPVSDGAALLRNGREFVRLLNATSHAGRVEALAVIADEVASNIAQGTENTSDDGIEVELLDTWQN
ncbi:MAG TPA: folate-binding protein [Dyella sp.]|uniref:CAF17-like 4Fe-4S cluster assembly/insertion protein YgfZ n=1 Tax=Dyella sp. TaxID=1869338 RepID=UPI002C44FDBE|nr:folate-binding protein [Dyella sp.]HTV86592.1 folate-binding protein [Dyella sp.]